MDLAIILMRDVFLNVRGRLPIGVRLYLSVLSLFVVFAVAFIVFQQYREKQYKTGTLDLRLQDFNQQVHEALSVARAGNKEAVLNRYLALHAVHGLRMTVIRRDGRVVFDNVRKDYAAMGNHAARPEVADALKNGRGSAVDRNSPTLGHDYFYSATFFPADGYVIRSALPYDINLAKSLRADQHYIWFAVGIMALLTFVLYRFTYRLGKNITKLNDFAARASSLTAEGEWGGLDELLEFSDDELGDTAERIVKLYVKLQRTQQQQNVLKRQLTQNVAHELKTPVASIQGYLETILENPKVDGAVRKQFLERCYAQSQRLAALLNDMSTLNRLDDGAGMMAFEDVDVAEIIRTVEKESQLALEQKGMTMSCDIPAHIPIHGNRSLIYSIFRNLADNSIAYAGRGTRIVVKASKQGWRQPADNEAHGAVWQFTFSDNGVGVAPEHLPRLFERFYRVDKGRSRKMGGTGLGLAIVKNAVRVHGGSISVANNPGGGLRFDFTLR